MTTGVFFRGLIWILTLSALGYAIKTTGIGSSVDKTWIDSDVLGQGPSGELLFIGVCVLYTAIGLPRQVICFLGGYAFGLTIGTILSLIGTLLGCFIAFFYARLLGQNFIVSRFSGRVKNIDNFLRDNPLSMTLLIRLLPIGSNLVTNLAAGVSSVRPLPFFQGSAIGYLPQTVIFALVGSGFSVDPELRIAISVVLFMISGIIGISLYRKYGHGKSFDRNIEYKLGVDVEESNKRG